MSTLFDPHNEAFGARAERIIVRWVGWYTGDLEPEVREDRLSELKSDLWDHRASARVDRRTDIGTAFAMTFRAMRGIPGDLSWRHSELMADPGRRGLANRWARSGTAPTSYAVVLAVIAFAVVTWARILVSVIHGDFLPSDTTMTSLLIGSAGIICGLVLFGRPRLRWMAALWLGLGSVLLLHFGFIALTTLSTSFYGIVNRASLTGVREMVDPLIWVALISTGAFFVALALAWAPLPKRSAKEQS